MNAILPGATIGILGGGQLGRMLAMEAHRMGYRVGVFDPQKHGPATQVADFHVQSEFIRNQSLVDFVSQADVITLETELIPSKFLADIKLFQKSFQATRPSNHVLVLVQDRLTQRQFLKDLGLPQTSFGAVADPSNLSQIREQVAFPAILKKRCSGYDGKGQVRVDRAADLHDAWQELGEVPSVLEARVFFKTELSVVLARGLQGEIRFYPLAENIHQKNILHVTRVPAHVDEAVRARAEELAGSIAEALNYCGVLAVEFFLLEDDKLLVNEIAPRPHNSGHFTLGACATSQFEQHLRAICGLPLGDSSLLQPVVMVNLLGDLWRNGSPPWDRLLTHPRVRLHLYGKDHARLGRKMGHFLFFGEDGHDALPQAETLLREIDRDMVAALP